MASIPEYFNFGDPSETSIKELIDRLSRMYTDLAIAVNGKPDLIQRSNNGVPTDGASTDTFLAQGTININTATNKVEMITNHTSPTNVTWTTLS